MIDSNHLDPFRILCEQYMTVHIAIANYDVDRTEDNRAKIIKARNEWLEKEQLYFKRFER